MCVDSAERQRKISSEAFGVPAGGGGYVGRRVPIVESFVYVAKMKALEGGWEDGRYCMSQSSKRKLLRVASQRILRNRSAVFASTRTDETCMIVDI